MNAKQIDHIFEVLFQGDPGEDKPEPLNKRFNWVDPKTKMRPPIIPPEMLPGEEDFRDLDQGEVQPEPEDISDKVGSIPRDQMISRDEVASMDDLLDRYTEMVKTYGPEAAKAWMDNYRTAEFESIVRKITDLILD